MRKRILLCGDWSFCQLVLKREKKAKEEKRRSPHCVRPFVCKRCFGFKDMRLFSKLGLFFSSAEDYKGRYVFSPDTCLLSEGDLLTMGEYMELVGCSS
jgi:hypothetical protein